MFERESPFVCPLLRQLATANWHMHQVTNAALLGPFLRQSRPQYVHSAVHSGVALQLRRAATATALDALPVTTCPAQLTPPQSTPRHDPPAPAPEQPTHCAPHTRGFSSLSRKHIARKAPGQPQRSAPPWAPGPHAYATYTAATELWRATLAGGKVSVRNCACMPSGTSCPRSAFTQANVDTAGGGRPHLRNAAFV